MYRIILENLDFQSVLDVLALIQGLTLCALLFIINDKRYRSTIFLATFLLLFSIKLTYYISKSLTLDLAHSYLCLLPFNFSWLLFPLFFVYTQQVSVFANETKYWVLIPGILSFIAQLIIYALPFETKLLINGSLWHELTFTFIGILYSWGIGIWNLKLIHNHNVQVQNTFSHIGTKVLKWAQMFVIYSLCTSFIIHILYFISPINYYFKMLFSIFDLITIYWVSVNGVIQRNVPSILLKYSKEENTNNQLNKNQLQLDLIKSKPEELMLKINNHMILSETYTNPNLTIVDLAKELEIHPKRLSANINTQEKQNFNSYINRFRINKAKSLLSKNKYGSFNSKEIGEASGFRSKSAFYSAFRKETGSTPSDYFKKLKQ